MKISEFGKENILLPSYRGRLLEGVTYNKANNTLLWVDIINAEVHRVVLGNDAEIEKSHEFVKFAEAGESVGNVFLTKDPDTVLLGTRYGICKASFKEKSISYILKYPLSAEKAQRLRSNDGIIDPWGNIWIGLMNDFPVAAEGGIKPEGYLFRISAADLSVKTMVENALIANGLAFSDDGKKFYWTDSLTFTVWQFDYDHERVELKNRRPLMDARNVFTQENSPEPDGLALTRDGHFFHAIFSTSSVIKYNVEGEAEARFKIPAERVTCAGLGGKNDDELFITTAHQKLDDFGVQIDAGDKSADLGGFLFRVKLDLPVNSQPPVVWGGEI